MIPQISFCISTARNERYHLELLFRSLNKNLSRKDHEILVFIENDNQGTTEWIVTQRQLFPNLKIIKNPLPVPIGYQRNVNIMFEMAKYPITSYIQSDMVVGPKYDEEIIKYLTPDSILSSTRIEPPLHPPSFEKITYDFGLDPKTFDLDTFSTFAETQKKTEMTDFWFSPFTLYKKNWNDIGGHDTLFRRAREDSDLLYRFTMKGLNIKQIWNAVVYHFTCVSSRGPEWWTEKSQKRTQLQQMADRIEMTKFMRKWPKFKHTTTFDPLKEYKHPVSVNFKNVSPHNAEAILQNYYLFDKIYIDNPIIRAKLKIAFGEFQKPANILFEMTAPQWNQYKKYYHVWEFEDIFVNSPLTEEDVILDVDPQSMDVFTNPIVLQINDIIHQSDPGRYECGTGVLIINRVVNKIQDNIVVQNPPLDDVDFIFL